jgi:uncharacterized membrane protein YgcG
MVVREHVVSVETTRSLGYKEGLTVAIGLPKGVITGPGTITRARQLVLQYAIVLLPVVAFLAYFIAWRRIGKDPQLARSVMVRYEPPEDLKPSEVGALVDGRVDQHDVSALLVDLAVRDYLRIEETEDVTAWVFRSRSYTFHRVKEPGEWRALQPFEREMLEGLFQDGAASVELSKLTNRFYTSLEKIQRAIYDSLTKRGYFRVRPDWVRSGTSVMTWVALVGGGLLAMGSVLTLDASPLVAGGAALVTIAVVLLFSRIMPALTLKGALARLEVLGFEEFLSRAERERLKLATPETFEAYLPYAMALRVEEQWAEAFEGIYTEPPQWYAGHTAGTTFAPAGFTRSLTAMGGAAASTFASSPRSSGGSGFGGGGGSGGGSGGGGGGAV